MRPSMLSTIPAIHSFECAPVSSRQRGFTAVEIIAVASIIAILAMLLIPMMRGYVETAKKRACVDEMGQISKCMDVASAENNSHYFRLQDLDNTTKYLHTFTTPVDDRTSACPFGYLSLTTNTVMGAGGVSLLYVPYTDADRKSSVGGALDRGWRGPYSRVQKAAKISEILIARSQMLTLLPDDSVSTIPPLPCAVGAAVTMSAVTNSIDVKSGGPILYSTTANHDETSDLYPIDPWGNPYIFLPYVGAFGGRPGIFSMGPDGMPGSLATITGFADYYPVDDALSTGLGSGDDLYLKM